MVVLALLHHCLGVVASVSTATYWSMAELARSVRGSSLYLGLVCGACLQGVFAGRVSWPCFAQDHLCLFGIYGLFSEIVGFFSKYVGLFSEKVGLFVDSCSVVALESVVARQV